MSLNWPEGLSVLMLISICATTISCEEFSAAKVDQKSPVPSNVNDPRSSEPDFSSIFTDDEIAATNHGREGRSYTNDDRIDNLTDVISDSHMQFTLDLMNALIYPQSDQSETSSPVVRSVLLSPTSVQTVLMMMHLGARAKTRQEISQCLHFPVTSANGQNQNKLQRRKQTVPGVVDDPKRSLSKNSNSSTTVTLASIHESYANAIKNILSDSGLKPMFSLANQVFYQESLSLSAQYESALKHYYSTQVRPLDFQSGSNSSTSGDGIQTMINEWIEKQTKGRITKFLTLPISPATLLMAINVLHFKGEWQYRFDAGDTDLDAQFTLHDGKNVKVPMMMAKLPVAFAHDPSLKVSIIEFPYKAQRLALFLVLPDEHDGIPQTIQSLNSTSLTALIRSMRKVPTDQGGINVRIPRFTIDSTPQLTQILGHQLGLKSLFSADMADLSGMFSKVSRRSTTKMDEKDTPSNITPVASLDELVHKAILEVDEMGSVGAAASATIVERIGTFNGQYFEADHPFLLFMIDKQSGLILFSGLYGGPTNSN